MSEISEEQFAELERHHGKDMVLVLRVGPEECFAFRRPSELDVDLALSDRVEGKFEFHEECAIRCLLTADAPALGGSTVAVEDKTGKTVQQNVAPELVAERMKLRALWKRAPFTRDTVGLGLAELCGWHLEANATALGGGRYSIVASSPSTAVLPNAVKAELSARVLEPAEYSELRKRQQTMPEGAAERYAWSKQVDAAQRDELARLYPYLVVGIGQTLLPTLGSEGLTVRPKKYGAGQAPALGDTTETPAPTGT